MVAKLAAFLAELGDRSRYRTEENADAAEQMGQELFAIQSIYSDEEMELLDEDDDTTANGTHLLVRVPIEAGTDNLMVRLRVDLEQGYPMSKNPPTLTLCNRYLGPYKTDDSVHAFVRNTFHDPSASVRWVRGESVLFEGIDAVVNFVRSWYASKCASTSAGPAPGKALTEETTAPTAETTAPAPEPPIPVAIDASLIVQSTHLVERKSEFLGHAVRLTHPDQVPLYLDSILDSDKRIQRAAHPAIHAWVCRTDDGVVHHGTSSHLPRL